MWWNLIWSLVLMVAVGFVAGRLLGIARGPVRAVVAGLLGWVVGQVLGELVHGGRFRDDDWLSFGLADLLFALGATMVLSIGLELLLRPRRPDLRLSLRKRVRAGTTVVRRLWQVLRIARRNGLGRELTNRAALGTPATALRVRQFLEQCGGVFVKFGQIAATRSDLLPPQLVAELTTLQTAAPTIPWPAVAEQIEAQFNAPVETLFTSIDTTPLAAASIGQIHTAVLPDGRAVVVKVRRPDVEVGVVRDSAVLRWASRAATRRSAAARTLGLNNLVDEVIGSLNAELDFVREAANGRALAESMPATEGVAVPSVVTSLTGTAVLVLDRVDGRPLSDAAAVDAAPVERRVLAERLFSAFLNQVMVAGVFHADPHPGNVLLAADGTLWFIDFGAVGILDPITLEAVQLMGVGLGLRDPELIARALRALAGASGQAVDTETLTAELSKLLSEQRHAGGFDPRSLDRIIKIMGRHGIPVPPGLSVLGRAMVTMEGTLRGLFPGFDLAAVASRQLSGRAAVPHGFKEVLQHEAIRSLPSLRALPRLTEDIALQLRTGRLSVLIDPVSDAVRREVGGWVDRVLFTVVAAVTLLASTALFIAAAFTPEGGVNDALTGISWFGFATSSVMLMRVVAQALRRGAG
jgi:ubiquinone biosynthesis protein